MTPFSIGVDWDDVIMPWYAKAVEVCREAGICPADVDPKTWSMHEEMGCSLEEWIAALDVATESGVLYDTLPMEGTVEAIRNLYWRGHFIHIVTARGTFHGNRWNDHIQDLTRAQIEEFAVPNHSVTFTRDKTAVPTDYFVDDSPRNFHALRQAGVNAFLLTRPWNLDIDTPYRVESVAQFADIVMEAE